MDRHSSLWASIRCVSPLAILLALSSVAIVRAEQPTAAGKTVVDVMTLANQLTSDIDTLRFHMGKPRNTAPPVDVANVQPREVYVQALALRRNTNRLRFEFARDRSTVATKPNEPMNYDATCRLIVAAHSDIQHVMDAFEIPHSPPLEPAHAVDANEALRTIVQANRQLNLLLKQRVPPADVFERVTVGVGYAAELLKNVSDPEPIPVTPQFVAGKKPADVYRRLLHCFAHVKAIAEANGVAVMDFYVQESDLASVEPSDVSHLASLLVSELAYLHSLSPQPRQPHPVYSAGDKFPAHVFQRGGILEIQLQRLHEATKSGKVLVARQEAAP
ncbi:hypothetical protein [Blastopirellula retiformator]|uniref:Uncharacterized protein n=1 Tax=Blastopirellula retiformator TaxID=2527970 RepID=A0A5C5V7X3_9BACT|nr:hypothetical protein [Blastopirellula retiformator]TWT34170.1 hypothetical protein Enr8_15640 [Blastopirellula retiformator]